MLLVAPVLSNGSCCSLDRVGNRLLLHDMFSRFQSLDCYLAWYRQDVALWLSCIVLRACAHLQHDLHWQNDYNCLNRRILQQCGQPFITMIPLDFRREPAFCKPQGVVQVTQMM